MIFGHPLPFDRHDWTILRPDGTEIRYVIDYYVDETKASEKENSGMPNMHDRDAIKSVLVDVRPAVDTVGDAFGRAVTMPYSRRFGNSKFEPMPIVPDDALKNQISESEKVWDNIQRNVEQSKNPKGTGKSMILKQEDIPDEQKENSDIAMKISDDEARNIAKSFVTMLANCQSAQKVVNNCKDDAECAKASLALSMCLAKVVCPVQQDALAVALNADDFDPNDDKASEAYNARFEKAVENMTICVTAKSHRAALARDKYPELFKDAST
jgi:cytochrome c heme-lyase